MYSTKTKPNIYKKEFQEIIELYFQAGATALDFFGFSKSSKNFTFLSVTFLASIVGVLLQHVFLIAEWRLKMAGMIKRPWSNPKTMQRNIVFTNTSLIYIGTISKLRTHKIVETPAWITERGKIKTLIERISVIVLPGKPTAANVCFNLACTGGSASEEVIPVR